MSRPRAKVTKPDVDLAASAKAAAGGLGTLARMFGVSKQAASEWGRVRPIPRHVRPGLEQLVRQRTSAGNEGLERRAEDAPWRSLGWLVAGTGLELMPPLGQRCASKATGAWRAMTQDQRDVLRNYVRRAALISAVVEQLLPDNSARKIIATLSTEVSAHVNGEILRFTR